MEWSVWSLAFLPTARALFLTSALLHPTAISRWRLSLQDGSLMALGHDKGMVEASSPSAGYQLSSCLSCQVLRFPSLQPAFRERQRHMSVHWESDGSG